MPESLSRWPAGAKRTKPNTRNPNSPNGGNRKYEQNQCKTNDFDSFQGSRDTDRFGKVRGQMPLAEPL